jgi:WD40 repeat protein
MFHRTDELINEESFVSCFVDASQIAVPTNRGQIHLFSLAGTTWKESNSPLSTESSGGVALTSAVTSLQYDATRRFLFACCSNGNFSVWHLTSRKLIHCFVESDMNLDGSALPTANEIYVAKLNPLATSVVTGGKDAMLRIYDNEKLQMKQFLVAGSEDGQVRAHSSKINSLVWAEGDLLLSGGWDYTVQLWDIRASRSVGSIFGPYLCGDGMDLHRDGHTLVTASTRGTQQLELWDVRQLKKIQDVPWPAKSKGSEPPSLMAARFSHNGKWLAAGGSRDFRILDATTLNHGAPAVVADLGANDFAVFGLGWNHDNLAISGSKTIVVNAAR